MDSLFAESFSMAQVRHRPEFRDLPTDLVEAFDRIKRVALLPRGATLFRKGERPSGVFVLSQGRARILMSCDQRKKDRMRLVGQGEMLGLSATVSGLPYEMTVETVDVTEIAFIDRKELLALLRQDTALALNVMELLGRDLRLAYHRVRCAKTQ